MKKIAVIGAGGWGTSLAITLAHGPRPRRVCIWVHGRDVLQSLCERRENVVYLPGFAVPEHVEITSDLASALRDADIVLGAMPTAHARSIYSDIATHLRTGRPAPIFVSASKGLEHGSLARMSQVIAEALAPAVTGPRIAVLSGPSFARELANGDPTAVAIASENPAVAAEVQEEFAGPTLRLYTNPDVIGVEICAAAKNVIAIAAGVCSGLGLGSNAGAALITRGLAEITRLSVAAGGRRDTPSGLAGLGDLILTATGSLSRNRSVGFELGKGRPLSEILAGMRTVAEGIGTTAAMIDLARQHGVQTPIAEQVHAVLHQQRSPRQAIRELMDRPLKQE